MRIAPKDARHEERDASISSASTFGPADYLITRHDQIGPEILAAPSRPAAEYPLFDWLRFSLASIVALGHEGIVPHSDVTGNLSVQVFFALSGWLIGSILIRSSIKQLPRFFFNRATRIWVPYFFAIGALYTVSALREPITGRWLEFLFYDLSFTHNWFSLRPDAAAALAEMPLKGTGNGFWSISVEEQFYLVAPLIILGSRFGRVPQLWMVVSLAVLYFGLTDFASISIGVSAASVQARFGDLHLRRRSIIFLSIAATSSLILLVQPGYYPVGAPPFALCIVLLCARPGLRTQPGILAGAISYPMYLNHWIAAFVLNGVAKHVGWLAQPALGFCSYGLAVIVASCTYYLVDRNVMKNRGPYYSPTLGKTLGALAYTLVLLGILGGVTASTEFY
ncbi:acyltransferase family protein [Bradyrhizobium guangdongense]|uniref:acyltransferase family protein n=1 Tax=Bradyrhizobium guangdongense TaxID=1325090 RepID=UPI0013E8ADF8|nr:acyltransferase [Bradyrhizobium guangdongense]